MVDFLLINGFTPLRRSPSDIFLDNGIGMLAAALRKARIDFDIVDPVNRRFLSDVENRDISVPLRALFDKKLFGAQPLSPQENGRLESLYADLRTHHDRVMDRWIASIAQRAAACALPVLGVKLWSGSTFVYAEKLCQAVRAASPHTLLVAGGPQVNCFYHEGKILQHSDFDVAVYAEGDEALVDIVRTAVAYRDIESRRRAVVAAAIPNTVVRTPEGPRVLPRRGLDVNARLVPDYGDAEGKIPVHTIIDALGCDYGKCHFCVHPHIYPRFQRREVAKVVDEIETMVHRGIGMFTFTASDTPIAHGARIAQELLDRGLSIEFTMLTRAVRNAGARMDKLVPRVRTLVRAGLKTVFIGAESGNDAVLTHVMNKGVTADDIAHTVACFRRAAALERRHVNIITSFIFPVPLPDALLRQGITQEQVERDNLDLIARMRPDSFHAAPGLLYPGTAWYTRPQDFNINFSKQAFDARWIRQELSYHGYAEADAEADDALFSVNGVPLRRLVEDSLAFARKGNALGIPSDLWEEHFTLADASGVRDPASLLALSKDLFLDLLVCADIRTRPYYDKVEEKSRRIAMANVRGYGVDAVGG